MDNITTAGMTQVILEYKPVFDEDGNPVMEDCSVMDPYSCPEIYNTTNIIKIRTVVSPYF